MECRIYRWTFFQKYANNSLFLQPNKWFISPSYSIKEWILSSPPCRWLVHRFQSFFFFIFFFPIKLYLSDCNVKNQRVLEFGTHGQIKFYRILFKNILSWFLEKEKERGERDKRRGEKGREKKKLWCESKTLVGCLLHVQDDS